MRTLQIKDCVSCLARKVGPVLGPYCAIREKRLRNHKDDFPQQCPIKKTSLRKKVFKPKNLPRLKCSWCGNFIGAGEEIYIHVPEKKAGKDNRVYESVHCLEQYIWTKNECLEAVNKPILIQR